MNNTGKLIVFSAPSGSGKTTIVRHLLGIDELNLEFSISAATRAPRGEEINGKDYYFMSIEDFKTHIKAEDFVEWEEVYPDNYYGTLITEIERIFKLGKNVIFDIDVAGGLCIKNKFSEQTLAIFVKPPSIEELKRRLVERSTESEDKINMRIKKANIEIEKASEFDIIIENKDINEAKQEAYNLVKNHLANTNLKFTNN